MSSRAAICDTPILVGADHWAALYGNTTSTLKNLIPALFSSVTGCHSPAPSSVAADALAESYSKLAIPPNT